MRRALLFLAALLTVVSTAQAQYSVILENGTVFDGTGAPGQQADVGIQGDRIAAIGDLSGATAAIRLDVSGRAVAPGFIDIHSHADGREAPTSSVGQRPLAENYLRQGVTTAMGGQDGSSPLEIGNWLAYFDAMPAAINVGLFIGHGTVRGHVMGSDNRPPTEQDLTAMTALVKAGMDEGAFGLSSGLEYTPGLFAETEELVALAAATAPDGVYISHVRDEGGRLMESVDEVIRIAREAGVAGQLTHHKIIGKGRWGGTTASLARVDEARAEGTDITLDVYPYTASSTGMTILFPSWAKEGGTDALVERIGTPETAARIRADVIAHINAERGGDPSTIVAARCSFDPGLDGKSLADMAVDQGLQPSVEVAADIAMDLVARGGCQGVFHSMGEEDVARVIAHPHAMLASDGGVPALGSGMPHPRNYGSFARLFARYTREQGVVTLPDAIRKVTSLPAGRLGLEDRGTLEVGAVADIVVFDPASIQDHATFQDPHQYASGVDHVFVGGQPALMAGEPTGLRSGVALRRPARP